MIKNQDGTYIYLVVPDKYNCVYEKLLIKLSDLGIDILKDCGATCRGINRSIINCWNMFQSACAAYSLGEEKKSDLLINYINEQLKCNCPYYSDEAEQKIEITNFKLNITNVTGSQILQINSATFNITNKDAVKANSLKIINVDTNETLISNLSIDSPVSFSNIPLNVVEGHTYRFKATIEDNKGTIYTSNIYSITCAVPEVVLYNYYGTNEDVTTSTIVNGNKTLDNTIARLATPTKVVWFAIPSNKKLIIDNADMSGDWFYNMDAGYTNNRLENVQTVIINNQEYSFYKFVYFVNIEINLKVTIS